MECVDVLCCLGGKWGALGRREILRGFSRFTGIVTDADKYRGTDNEGLASCHRPERALEEESWPRRSH